MVRSCSIEGCAGTTFARALCGGHYHRWYRYGDPLGSGFRPPEDRFWAKTNRDGPTPAHRPDLGPCWLWTAAQVGNGYGQFNPHGRLVLAHRFAYELLIGPIPDGLQLDHLCRVRRCVRPSHLEPVTQQVNILRGLAPEANGARQRAKTHCPQGHAYDAENTYIYKGERECRACGRVRNQAWRARKGLTA